jgi:hypothetical protein
MNSGDWVESLTALVEDRKGNWELLYFLNENHFEPYEEEDLEEIDDEAQMSAKGIFVSISDKYI